MVFDGAVGKRHFPDGQVDGDIPLGVIQGPKPPEAITEVFLTPLMFFCRPLERSLNYVQLIDYTPTGRTLAIAGTECIELIPNSKSPDSGRRLYLDAKNGYVMRRLARLNNDQVSWQLDAAYKNHGVTGQQLESWTFTRFGKAGRTLESVRAAVQDLRLNDSVPESRFQIDFPPGTHVFDKQSGKEYRVQSNSVLREYSPVTGELGPEAVSQHPTALAGYWKWAVIAAIAALATLFVYAVRRRRSTRNR